MPHPELSRRRFLQITSTGLAAAGLSASTRGAAEADRSVPAGSTDADGWVGEWIGYNPVFPRQMPPGGAESRMDWRGANWVWTGEAKPGADAPAGPRWFRWSFQLPDRPIKAAWLQYVSDDLSYLLVNGKRRSCCRANGRPMEREMRDYVFPGRNVFGVQARHSRGTGGWSLKLCVEAEDGSLLELTPRDGEVTWTEVAPNPDPDNEDWGQPGTVPADWKPASILGAMGIAPWGMIKPHGFRVGSNQSAPPPLLRRTFSVAKPLRRARLRSSGLGCHEVYCNGAKVGDAVLEPAMSQYDRSVLYAEHDVAAQLKPGRNALGVMLGHGWLAHTAATTWDFDLANWSDRPKLRLDLRLEYEDGTVETIASDTRWRAATGPVLTDDFMNGEVYDARLEVAGWSRADFDDATWAPAELMAAPGGVMRAQLMAPMRVTETLKPVKRWSPRPGVFIFDLGQNITGWARIRLRGAAGHRVDLRFGEVLVNDRVDRYMGATIWSGIYQEDRYFLRGGGPEEWEPRFTYHAFRFVEVENWPGTPELADIDGRAVHTDFPSAGRFACSSEMLNRLQTAILWGYRGNFHGFPTDCPSREKKGWLADAHLACEQAMLNWDNRLGYAKWMQDFTDRQYPDGSLKCIIPTPEWGAELPDWTVASILIPWTVHVYTGDLGIVADSYPMMRKWAAHRARKAKGFLQDEGISDWLPAKTKTPVEVTSTCYYYGGVVRLAEMATRLGHAADAAELRAEAAAIARAFQAKYVKADGTIAEGSQSAQACALYFGLVPENLRVAAARRLSEAVTGANDHVDVGILGAKVLFRILSDYGYHEQAYRMATQPTAPGYFHLLTSGRTTLTEDWYGNNSQNHIMLGDISAWCYQYLAGIEVDEAAPGFRHFYLKPRPVADLTWAQAEHRAPNGLIKSGWTRQADGSHEAKFTVPRGSRATVVLPDGRREEIAEGDFRYTWRTPA